ncbi:MAG: alpha/beta fold hydrolase [Rhodobacter sp.]|nr:alpha/beta fold hydrolase [Paracoccaceae bacterium]MCC0076340.1 alpha/beta fold hydrolase [Rhodobacter sp.]
MSVARLVNGIATRIDGERGTWVVLSNGIATDMSLWDAIAADLSRDFRVLRHDWPGHGASGDDPLPQDLAGYATRLAAVLDDLGIRQAHLAGVSMGAMVSAELALARPDLAGGVTWCNAIAQANAAYSAFWRARAAQVIAEGMLSLVDVFPARWLSASAGADLREKAQRMILGTRPAGFAAAAGALASLSVQDRLAGLQAPLNVVAGEMDGAAPAEEGRTLARTAGAMFDLLPGVAHLSPLEAADRLAEILRCAVERQQ